MSVNEFMHPRNIYKNKPDYNELSVKYPEFMSVSTVDLDGKIKLDFKNQESFRILNKCLLHKDFNLDVFIPPDKLVPTLPLRLNYILWLEDVLTSFGVQNIVGIDIGCGASCIYPLLTARKNDWKMFGLEIDEESVKFARENVIRNGLEDKIRIIEQKTESILLDFVEKYGEKLDFCMCNPPFYNSLTELNNNLNRTGKRKPPPNAKSGAENELTVEGGEISFITKIVEESLILKDKIGIYTTMIGHKKNVDEIIALLKSLNINNFVTTKFCQGNTTRWGVSWTFKSSFHLPKTENLPSKSGKSAGKPLQITLFKLEENKKLEDVKETVLKLFSHLEFKIKQIEEKPFSIIWEIEAFSNTWSHQRRKRRQEKNPQNENKINEEKDVKDPPLKIPKLEAYYLKSAASLKLEKGEIILQMSYLCGNAGKDATNQVFQYLRNNLK